MRNYIDPKMKIAMWETENIATDASGIKQATDFLNGSEAGASNEGIVFDTKSVTSGNVLNFAD